MQQEKEVKSARLPEQSVGRKSKKWPAFCDLGLTYEDVRFTGRIGDSECGGDCFVKI